MEICIANCALEFEQVIRLVLFIRVSVLVQES